MEARIVLHVDMDHFFTQVEARDDPSLTGRPVAVCMVSERRGSLGAVATANYEARAFGIGSGMPCATAKRIAPDIMLIPARKGYYSEISDGIMEALSGLGGPIEKVSIDEAYIDMSGLTGWDEAKGMMLQAKAAVHQAQGLTASVGAGPNKLIAKMASSQNKPDGITLIRPGEVDGFLRPKPIGKLHGVGAKTEAALSELGIATIGDLADSGLENISSVIGSSRALKLLAFSKGIDEEPVSPREKEQYGRMTSLEADTRDDKVMGARLGKLAQDVHERLTKNGKSFRTVTVSFVLSDLSMRTKSRTLPATTSSLETLRTTALSLMSSFLAINGEMIRRIGVNVSQLEEGSGQTALDRWS